MTKTNQSEKQNGQYLTTTPKKTARKRSIRARLTDGSLRIIPPRQTDNGSAQVPLSFAHPVEKKSKKN